MPDAHRPAMDRVVVQLLRWALAGQSDLLASYTCHLQGLARAGAQWPQEAQAQHARN